MTATRAIILLLAFTTVALGVVALRAEQTRAAARAVNLELKQVEARRELWRLQATVARLRSPERISDRIDEVAYTESPTQATKQTSTDTGE